MNLLFCFSTHTPKIDLCVLFSFAEFTGTKHKGDPSLAIELYINYVSAMHSVDRVLPCISILGKVASLQCMLVEGNPPKGQAAVGRSYFRGLVLGMVRHVVVLGYWS